MSESLRTSYRKVFWTFEQEERWLNEMSLNGLNLTYRSQFWRYDFVEHPEQQYTYTVDYSNSGSVEAGRFREFLGRSGWLRLCKEPAICEFSISVRGDEPNASLKSRYAELHYDWLVAGFGKQLPLCAVFIILGICNILRLELYSEFASPSPISIGFWIVFIAFYLFWGIYNTTNLLLALQRRRKARRTSQRDVSIV
ncbi:MAG: DUF2812 domain-containing protein [Clostridiales Family XIII bacterium]|jgi:hypothetical protein|nr:DUF2812 domain-containing protein [Clostridiales Family XIII bacterium]